MTSIKPLKDIKTAVIHDWLCVYGGAERVLEEILSIYPSDLFTIVDYLPTKYRGFLKNTSITTSFIQNLPFSKKYYQYYIGLMPIAIEQFDLSSYDIIISSSHAVAKGVITGPNQIHICYCHSPMRYIWDLQHQYLANCGAIKSFVSRYLFHKLRLWDVRTSNSVNYFIANSKFISKRIQKTYRRTAELIYPPVDTDFFQMKLEKQNYYFVFSRLVKYKKIDVIAQAFVDMNDKRLFIAGDGEEFTNIKAIVKDQKNITLLGFINNYILLDMIQNAKACIFVAEEDFGIAMIESQASGTPVITFAGGSGNELINETTGLLFSKQTKESIIDAVKLFETMNIDHLECRNNALKYSKKVFYDKFTTLVNTYILNRD